jgi:hypothetical protein
LLVEIKPKKQQKLQIKEKAVACEFS